MAITTTTTSLALAGVQPRAPHTGVVERSGRFRTIALGTDGDTYFLAKIPNKATITAVYGTAAGQEALHIFSVGIKGAQSEAGTAVLGTYTNTGSLTTAWSSGEADNISTALPYTVSMSDDAQPQHVLLTLTALTGTWSTTVSLAYTVRYSMDGL